MKISSFCAVLTLLRGVFGVEVLRPEQHILLNLSANNPDLLQYAARSGTNVTVRVSHPSQLIISQHDVYLTLDCGALLLGLPGSEALIFNWERKRNSSCALDTNLMNLSVSQETLLALSGENSQYLHFTPTNILCPGGQSSGDYQCKVCVTLVNTCLSRTTTILVIGSAPVLQRNRKCSLSDSGRNYTCFVGESVITLPLTLDPSTGKRLPNITRLFLSCDLHNYTQPSPRFSWIKDGEILIRDAFKNDFNDAHMIGNNLLPPLFMSLSPITISTDLRLQIELSPDESIWNVTGVLDLFPKNTTVDDLRRFILRAMLGNWTCIAENGFGSDSLTSTVTISNDCTNSCPHCEGEDATCEPSPINCECRCPRAFVGDPPRCPDAPSAVTAVTEVTEYTEDTEECPSEEASRCDESSEVCVIRDERYVCVCRPRFLFAVTHSRCIDCGLSEGFNNGTLKFDEVSDPGSLTAEVVCNKGLKPLRQHATCNVETDSAGDLIVFVQRPECVQPSSVSKTCRQEQCRSQGFVSVIVLLLIIISCLVAVLISWCYMTKDILRQKKSDLFMKIKAREYKFPYKFK